MKVFKNEKHFTSSVWIITKTKPKKVLLVFHKKFNLWIQPGGHIEKFENPVEAAIRETYEETGIDISFLNKKVKKMKDSSFLPVPEFILEEKIPIFKDQPEHFHLDLMYVVTLTNPKYNQNKEETKGIGFFTKEEALQLPTYENTRFIIKELLS